jgi:hypothetical protein
MHFTYTPLITPGAVHTQTLGELWKTKVVELMSEEEHASEMVLHGLFAIDHLLLSLAVDDPELIDLATASVQRFIADPSNRIKKKIPDFGRFQPQLLIADVSWLPSPHGPGACTAFIDESFTRNALWIQRQHPDLAATDVAIADRVERSWDASATGLRLLSFQVGYLRNAKQWADAAAATAADPESPAGESLAAVYSRRRALRLALFSKLGGRPDQDMVEAFQRETKAVQKISTQINIFRALGGSIDRAGLEERLVTGMRQSSVLGYHGPRNDFEGSRGGRGNRRGGGRGRGGRGDGEGRGRHAHGRGSNDRRRGGGN